MAVHMSAAGDSPAPSGAAPWASAAGMAAAAASSTAAASTRIGEMLPLCFAMLLHTVLCCH
jgi:hypothetical protein